MIHTTHVLIYQSSSLCSIVDVEELCEILWHSTSDTPKNKTKLIYSNCISVINAPAFHNVLQGVAKISPSSSYTCEV